ncbi:cytoplasmic dynein 2 heavy chain 1 [Copidosoma floridanum]|uniref:cytoplasmic dynein 2 heavy chain 1 n=1 Tax=Copidosoma floridanum TaxID=29053 RepID=UPI000C6F7CBB|nr:cytoplasmic dynein 2 heavy chain 1 [Copidosoma floridanum]
MVAADRRRGFIVATAYNFFGVSTTDRLSVDEVALLEDFLDRAKCRTLCAVPLGSGVQLTNDVSPSETTLVFFKISESPVTERNFHEVVQVASVSKNRTASLAEAIRQVWTPALHRQGFESLHLRKLEDELLGPKATASLVEEEALMRDKSRTGHERKLYDQAVLHLKNIRRELESAAVAREGLLMVEETLDSVSGHLDELWKLEGPVYSEERMRLLLEIIGSEIAQIVKSLIAKAKADPRAKDEATGHGAVVCQKWVEMSVRMTSLFWPHHSSHVWKGKPCKPEKCSGFETRLKEIAEIRAQNRQLTRLLTQSERVNLGTDALFEKFDNVEELLGEENDVEWERLKDKVYNGLAPVEERVAAKLKVQITGAKTALALETEFRRYSELMKREAIKGSLRPERQALLSAYADLIDACQNYSDTTDLLDTPEILQNVQAARVLELRLESLQKLGKQLLGDLPGYEEIAEKLKNATREATRERQELTEQWVNETRQSVVGRELSLGNETAVVELTSAKLMRVNFDPRLTALIREARGMSAQGVELPREVKDLVERASALTGRARALEQIANFHNTIGDRMIASQRPLMLATALELAAAVREQSGVVWSDPRAVDFFTNRLREMVKKFARQNAELASKHANLRDLVCNLLKGDAVNLALNQSTWKEALRSMRDIVGRVEYTYGNSKAWKLHWDRQLLKVLSIAYRAALPTLVKKLPEVRAELTYRDESLMWRPSLEDIRMKLYSGVRRFLVIPVNFRGVGDEPDEHFRGLVAQSAHMFGAVYGEAEGLLAALDSFRVKWLPLVAPAKIDIGQTLKGKQPQDWEKAFKDAKQWAQEVGKLRANEVKISCVVVDTGTIRNDLESLSRRYWERLSLDLRAEASSRLISIVDFLSSSSKRLSHRARTIEEIGEAYEAYSSIQKQMDEVARELEDVSGLGRVLAAWTRERLEGLSNAHASWDGLKERLDNYQGVMVHQMEEAKLNLRHQVLAVHDEQERWRAKWAARPSTVTKDWIEMMREKWTNITEQRDILVNDCKRLSLPVQEIFESDENTLAQMEAELEAEELNCKFQGEFIEELQRHEEEEWGIARRRLPKFHDWLDSWQDRVQLQTKDRQGEAEELARREAHSFIEKKIAELREALDLVQLLRGDDLADEHWSELRDILGLNVRRTDELTLGHLLRSAESIKTNLERVKDVTKRAAAESGIRQALMELEAWEGYTSLPIQATRDSKNGGIYVVGDYSALLARAGELRLIMDGARGAAGYERFASRASRCEAALYELEERLKILSIVQRKWVYLDPVYNSDAAPNDSGRWGRADKEFRYFMGEIARDPKIPSLKKLPLHALTNLRDLMDRCQKSLDDFLEEKRSAYPRLYFLSDEDLLELVSGKGKGLDAHLSKLYQGLGAVEISKNCVTSIVSPEGEKLELRDRVSLSETFPKWLLTLEEGIRNTLQQSLGSCLSQEMPEVTSFPTQTLLLAERIRFTEKCEAAIEDESKGLKNLLNALENQRELYRSLEQSGDGLTSLKAKNLLLETVHHLHVVHSLVQVIGDREKLAWCWNRQLRTYRRGSGAVVRCARAEFPYRFEYQGGGIGLVRTPLTEKCYLALTQAMKLGLGGSPTGPAGTGKTESVKALGGILGRRVLVFNCDEGMDAGSMRRILSGLAQAGAWGCFDEFNRLEEGTMSAVSMLIRPLQEAIRDGTPRANLGGVEIPVDPHCCLFVTMNPAGDDYGGRRKLPDSLARLFRPIGMAHPNKANIVQSLLECAGLMSAPKLANQLVETFDTAEKLLSKQPHYDWGLRALRSVLNGIPPSSAGKDDESGERARMLAAIKTSTMPKLVENDTATFVSLLNDVFSTTDASKATHETRKLESVLASLCEAQGLHESLITRCVQLKDQLQSRSGVAVVGPPGSGKSLIIKTLADATLKTEEAVKLFNIYPGAISKAQLLGVVDAQTREFKEGLLSSIISNMGNEPVWIILNGDVEPGWAEALNSALDDNRILTLPNGVGVKLGNGTRFIFETHKLSNASPATVSRLGIIHLGAMSPATLLSPRLLKDLPSKSMSFATAHLCPVIEQVLKFKKDQKSASSLLRAALMHLQDSQSEAGFTHALLAALCGQIEDPASRNDLARTVYQLTNTWCPDSNDPCDVLYNKSKDVLDPFTIDTKTMETEDGLIHLSGSMQRGISAALPWTTLGQSVIFRGTEGCGKNALLSAVLTLIKNHSDETTLVVKGSSVYGSKDLMDRLKRSCVKLDSSSGGRTYRPKNGSNLILVIEDLHLASKDLQELTRQLIQEGGFYENDAEFAKVSLTILSTGDSTTKLHPRLDSLLASHYLTPLQPKDLDAIVELHLKEALSDDATVRAWIGRMSPSIVEAFNEISTDKSTEKWTPRDLLLWTDSLKYYPKPESDSDITSYLIDASRRVFGPKLHDKQQRRLESIVNSRNTGRPSTKDGFYVWKGSHASLTLLSESQWRGELESAVTKCIREGDDGMSTTIPSYLLEITAGISWNLGCEQRGVLLRGRPGAGRKTAVKLVAVASSLRLVDSGPGKGKAAVKTAVQAAGVDGEPTILLLEEHHLRDEGFAILASAIVASGELPGLYASEELNTLMSPLVELAGKDEFSGSLEQFLYHRIRKYLRVVLVLDSSDMKSSWLSRSNLLRHCVQTTGQSLGSEWWLTEGYLTELAKLYGDDEAKDEFSGITEVVQAQLSAPTAQQAPARFIALLHKWRELRGCWLEDIVAKLKKLQAGIDRLKEAGDRVAKLEEDVTKQRRDLEVEKGRANAALEQITATMRGATGQRGEMTSLKLETEKESAELARRKRDIEGELGKVEPLVEQAAQAVAGISAEALSEVRSLRAPPAPVRDVLEGVLRLMGIRDTSWNSMKTFLAKRGVKEEIRNWDARRSSPASLEAVAKLVADRADSFEERTAKRASQAAAPLAAWVLANLQYGQILQQVAPLEREQRVLADRLRAAEAQIGKLESGLTSVEGKVARLQEELAAHSRGAAELGLRTEATEASLATARTLLGKLEAEHRDWQTQFQTLTERRDKLGADAALAASLLVYQTHPGSKEEEASRGRVLELLASERDRLQWRAQGLPADTESLVGATRAIRGDLVALFVDPSGVAVGWLRANVGGTRLEVTHPGDARFLTSVELAVRFGKPLLVEEVVELPTVLLPLLRRGRLRLGDRGLAAQRGFQLFLATRQESLLDALPSEADAVLVKISLGSGSRSLAERLIDKAILQETPEVESQRREALEREERLSGEMEAARLELLVQLGAARGQDVLQEGGGLLSSLELTQSKAKEIARALEDSRRDLEEIGKRSREHERLAKFAAILNRFVGAFASLSSLYVFTAETIADIFLEVERMRPSLRASGRDDRDKTLEKAVTTLTLHHCTRAAYRKHRLPMALHLALSLGSVPDEHRNLLLSGGDAYPGNTEFALPSYIQPEQKPSVRSLFAAVPEMARKIKANWMNGTVNIYGDEGLSSFEKLLVVQALHPEHLHTALSKWAAQVIGVRNLSPPAWTLKQVAEESESRPVLLLLSPGADPEPELRSLVANHVVPATGFAEVSLGQGHVAQAESALEAACKQGSWILLSNLQLALNWLPRLEALLRSPTCAAHKSPGTRIWLTTEECSGFYPGLSGLCLKVAYEPPEGVKRNVKRSLLQLQQRQPTIQDSGKALLIAWLHAVLQERRKFVPQGWIKAYAWSEGDLEAACELVVKKAPSSSSARKSREDWESDRGILDVAVYGGLLQDEHDMRALRALLKHVWSRDTYTGRRKLGGTLSVPKADSEGPIAMVDKLEDADAVQVYFGLPANAHRAWEKSAAESTLRHLNEIARRHGKAAKNHPDGKASLVSRTLKELKQAVDRQRVDRSATSKDTRQESDPLQRFFNDEANTTRQLLQLVRSDLDGRRTWEDPKTPAAWLSKWHSGPREVVPFVNQLMARHESLTSITAGGRPPGVQLSWFARPDAFLSAFKQYTARETGRAFERLRLRAQWSEDYNKDGNWKTSIFIEGLLLTGARIENGVLEEVTASASSVVTAPVCLIAFIEEDGGEYREESSEWGDVELTSELSALQVPVYTDSSRSRLVCSLPVPYVREKRNAWYQRGISFHLRTN